MSINDFVLDAIQRDSGLRSERIWTVENSEKYSTLDKSCSDSRRAISREIFSLMRALNIQGITDDNLCSNSDGRGSLKDIISEFSNKLANVCRNSGVHYIELGPEPVKTTCLFSHIFESSSGIRYTAIDVNEMSLPVMKVALSSMLTSEDHFKYIASDYRHVGRNQLERGQDISLITMLGFQEGNELPVTTGRIIRNLSGRETYIISEMQLYHKDREDSIHQFYANPNMVRFSELVALQQGYNPTGIHQITIVRLNILDDYLHVAVTLQPVRKEDEEGYLITNICIKYTRDQFRKVRNLHGKCEVQEELLSGDGTVAWQLAKFVA